MTSTKLERRLQQYLEKQRELERARFCLGTSEAAGRRAAKRHRGTLHSDHAAGSTIEMSGGRQYQVARDGSYRHLAPAAA